MQRAIIVKEFSACFFISKTSPRKSHCLLSFVGNLLLLLQLENTQSSIRATLSSSSISFFSLCVGEERMNFQHGVEHTLKTTGVVKSEQRREKQLESLKNSVDFFCIVLKEKKECI